MMRGIACVGRVRGWLAGTGVAAVVSLCALVVPVSAFGAEAPRWAITAVSDPTVMNASAGVDEVQSLKVSATAGQFVLIDPEAAGFAYKLFKWDAKASEVQAGLEELYGPHNVEVSGGPGDEEGTEPYTIVFTGEMAGRHVQEISTEYSKMYLSCTGATGTKCEQEATVTQTTAGRPWGAIVVTATNVGGAATDGGAITVADVLPANVQAIKISGVDAYRSGGGFEDGRTEGLSCSTVSVSCTTSAPVDTGDQLIVTVAVRPPASGAGSVDEASVSGGGTGLVSVRSAFAVGTSPAPFGPVPGSVVSALSSSQAGAHPDFTTQYSLDTSAYNTVSGDVKDVRFDAPPGLVGSTVGLPRCTMGRVQATAERPEECPADTIVGIATVTLFREGQGTSSYVEPVYNIAPSPGEPAAFAFAIEATPIRLDTSVLSDGMDNVRVTAPSLADTLHNFTTSVTVWGVPQEHVGRGMDESALIGASGKGSLPNGGTFGGVEGNQTPVPLMTSPQRCGAPLSTTFETDPWEEQGVYRSETVTGESLTGCDLVPFEAAFTFLPDTLEAGAPAGYSFDLGLPQHNEPGVLTTSSMRDASLTLPEGVVVNPSAAWGLKACSTQEFFGSDHPSQEPAGEAECPREARVGEVEAQSPDLEVPLKGQVFLGTPNCDPCTPHDAEDGEMVRLFIQLVGEGESGVIVKLEGHALINQTTGQITTVFKETPPLPVSHFRFVLEGGPRAVLANPRTCGKVTANGVLTPWSEEQGVLGEVSPSYQFEIKQNCFAPQFNPSIHVGPTNLQAGAYSPLDVSFSRSDEDQYLSGLEVKTPPGLLGTLANVPLCANAQAETGECSEGSLIGHTDVETGPGADPFLVEGGKIFLTESYNGAPYGLSIVVPAVAGPYTLAGSTGKGTVVVRAKVEVNPSTAALTVKTNAFPTILDGIPLQLRLVQAVVDRQGFTFNPTSCEPVHIEGALQSAEGMSASFSRPFQVTNCSDLKFEPTVEASVGGNVSRVDGTSFRLRISKPAVQGQQADLKRFKIALPTQLPSRLPTLQKACTAAQFESNPAGCPSASVVGHMRVLTPILPVAIEGPMYFVSHGGEAWPSLEIVLQGYGVKVILVGSTLISPSGVTTSTFSTVPDVPFTSAEATLPGGPYSALTGLGDLCAPTKTVTVKKKVLVKTKRGHKTVTRSVKESEPTSLVMPTEIVAQDGGNPIEVNTPVGVTECPTAGTAAHKKTKPKPHKKAKKHSKKK
ncbi:MAG TPA: hypothetical protein VNV42_14435 [Solirubrobacteraceae bacterium]|jgi:hypothetical protein|nr:hypothetical protein [Solirubrobacteraceae bacterium]